MKKLQKLLVIVIILIIITITNTKAYTGIRDEDNDILISEVVTDGQGIVDITKDIVEYKLYYQWMEIDNERYKQIMQLKNELQIIQYFNIYEITGNEEDYEYYYSSQLYYKELYGTYLEDCSEQKVDENILRINELLPEYKEEWERTRDNTFKMDLSSFSGTKDFVLWVQLEKQDGNKIYDSEVFELTGTKNEIPEEEQKDNIFISEIITNGKGIIEIARDIKNYQLYYQWVEIDDGRYEQIMKLKNELQIIQYFNIYEITGNEEDYEYYYSSQLYYKELYGTYLEDCSEEKVKQNRTNINELLPEYTNIWERTTDNTFEMDLSTFSGTKKYVMWVQLDKSDGTKEYNAEIFELTGTKQIPSEEEKQPIEGTPEEEPKDEEKPIEDDKSEKEEQPEDGDKQEDIKDEKEPSSEETSKEDVSEEEAKKVEEQETKTDKNRIINKSNEDDNQNVNRITRISEPKDNTTSLNKTSTVAKSDNTKTQASLPYSGSVKLVTILSTTVVMLIVAVIAFIRYRKIK